MAKGSFNSWEYCIICEIFKRKQTIYIYIYIYIYNFEFCFVLRR